MNWDELSVERHRYLDGIDVDLLSGGRSAGKAAK
jgi:hypothetical protein